MQKKAIKLRLNRPKTVHVMPNLKPESVICWFVLPCLTQFVKSPIVLS